MARGSRKRKTRPAAKRKKRTDAAVGGATAGTGGPTAVSDEEMIPDARSWRGDHTRAEAPPEEAEDSPSTTPAALAEKVLSGRINVTSKTVLLFCFVGWAVVCTWIFVQDNGAGRLNSRDGFEWLLLKVMYASAFAVVVAAVVGGAWLVERVRQRRA